MGGVVNVIVKNIRSGWNIHTFVKSRVFDEFIAKLSIKLSEISINFSADEI